MAPRPHAITAVMRSDNPAGGPPTGDGVHVRPSRDVHAAAAGPAPPTATYPSAVVATAVSRDASGPASEVRRHAAPSGDTQAAARGPGNDEPTATSPVRPRATAAMFVWSAEWHGEQNPGAPPLG